MKQPKILLVSANQHTDPYPVYPLGISYIRTYLSNKLPDYIIDIFDFNLNDINSFIVKLKTFTPDYVGISLRNIDGVNSFDQKSFTGGYRKIIEALRANHKCTVIIGGAGFSIYPERLFDYLNPDFGVYGEGEESFCNLIQILEQKTDYSAIEGLVYRKNEKIIFNGRSHYCKSLALQIEPEIVNYYWKNSGMLNIQTKRGCPYNCIYCTYPVIEGKKVRTLDADLIVKNLTELYTQRNINYIFFTDSVFNIKNDYNIELAEKIIASGINIKWGAYFAPVDLPEDLLSILKRSGLMHIEFGTESLSDVQLKNYGKHFTVDDIVKTSALCNKLDIYFAHFMILSGYGETEETLEETYENSKRIFKSVFFPYVGMRIYPGTKLQQIAINEGKIKAEDDLLEPVYYISDEVNQATIKEKAQKTDKAWVFPDDVMLDIIDRLRKKRNKKGPLWEYLRKS